MVASLTKSIEDMPVEDLERALVPILQGTWPALNQIFNVRYTDIELVEVSCDVIVNMCRAMRAAFEQFFDPVHEQLLQTFSKNSKNFKCL